MKEIKLIKGLVALVSDEHYELVSRFNWNLKRSRGTNYAHSKTNSHPRYILMHRLITKAPDNLVVDHIDGNGLNNQIENLRICSVAENNRNVKLRKDSKTGYKGVYFRKYTRKFSVQIKHEKKIYRLGCFDSAEEAARAYDEAARRFHGEFASPNFNDINSEVENTIGEIPHISPNLSTRHVTREWAKRHLNVETNGFEAELDTAFGKGNWTLT